MIYLLLDWILLFLIGPSRFPLILIELLLMDLCTEGLSSRPACDKRHACPQGRNKRRACWPRTLLSEGDSEPVRPFDRQSRRRRL